MKKSFIVLARSCYFCNTEEIINFREHWYFCPQCSAIYTHMILHKAGCKHVNNKAPVVTTDCWFRNDRRAKIFIKENRYGQVCSTCGEACEADGW